MKRNMIYTVLAAMSMFALLIIILVTSIQIAIYGDSEYHFYQKNMRNIRSRKHWI